MSEKITVPVLGESITEATVSKWLKKKGEYVQADEAVVELETDKVNLEVPSPVGGIIEEINAKDGEVVEVGSLLGSVNESKNISKEKMIKKIEPQKSKNNIVNLEIEKKQPRVFEKPVKLENLEEPLVLTPEEPLILTEEAKVDKLTEEIKEMINMIKTLI